ncbi:MAG: hypothetical protein PWP08_70, partial [Methanofollis sp.]|nr:hypothetical protein [Methanofollis sp.]
AGGEVAASSYNSEYDVVLGVAPEADLISAKVLDADGSGLVSDIIKGIQWSVENGADVISLSAGSYGWDENTNRFFSLEPGETANLTLEVSASKVGYKGLDADQDPGVLEPLFVVGGYMIPESYEYDESEPANLSVTLYAPGMAAAGGYVDWAGFEYSPYRVTFKAPYADNSENWNGIWTLQITNNGNETVSVDESRIAAAYQSDGNTAYDLTLNNLADLGVVAVVAAGNDGYYGTGTVGTPGTAEDVITVGATDYCMDYRANFSSIGPVNRANPYVKPDLMAPGVGIVSAYPNGQYAVMDGTSMATPGVAGTVALMLAGNESLTPAEIKQALKETAVHITEDGTAVTAYEENNLYGAGRISAYAAVDATGGLHGTPVSPSLTELFGGPSYDASTDTVKMLGVCWNATAGAPIEGETVDFSVYYYNSYYNPVYFNATGVTDADGMATATIDVAAIPAGTGFYARTTWQDRTLTDYNYVPSGGTNTADPAPLFQSQNFIAPPDGAVTIRYPLLNTDGSAYTGDVRLVVTNYTTTFFDGTLTPTDGVVTATVNFAGFNVSQYEWIPVTIDGRSAGYVSFSYEVYYEGISSPKLAICPPGGSIDIALQVAGPHGTGGTITSKDYDVYVTAFTETEILSLPSEVGGPLAAGMPVDGAALLEAAGGMTPEEIVGTVQVKNGIGVYNFTMPEDCYVAVVKFVDPDEFYGSYDSFMVSVVYGSMSPWTLHRVTPTVPAVLNTADSTYIGISDYAWPATWNQTEYRPVPADLATLTARVFTCNGTTGAGTYDAGKTVRLYTRDGVLTNTTGADGTCTFTLDVAGQTSEDLILITDGISMYGGVQDYLPFDSYQYSRVYPGILTGEQQAAAALVTISPDVESRWMDVDYQGGGSYLVSLHSYGPDDTPILEHGVFTASPYVNWMMVGTEFADTLAYTGTWTVNITPSQNGTYQASAGILNPESTSFWSMYWMFSVPEANVDYTVKPDVLVGETVPVTFTVTDSDGNPISNAKVGFFLGGAAPIDYYGAGGDDVRPLNIEHMAENYPDPYSEVLTGYTDANGRVTLTFRAPSSAMMYERNMLGYSDYVPYRVACYRGDEVIKADLWSYDGAFQLTAAALPDFVPSVTAPHVVKLNRDDSIAVNDLYLYVTNQGTDDFIHTDTDIVLRASVGGQDQSTTYGGSIAIDETKQVLHTSVSADASDYGIDTGDYHLPVDVHVNVTVNPGRTIDEISYANNNVLYPVRITAPDLAAEISVPSVVVQSGTATPIALTVTNQGEVPAVATTMVYSTTGAADETIAVPALGANESCTVWRNQTLLVDPGVYTFALAVNQDGATDYETTFANNKANRTVHCYLHPTTTTALPQDLVLVPGTTYDLPVVVHGAENLAAYQMTFTFDPAAVTVTDVTGDAIPLTAKNIMSGTAVFNGGTTTGVSGNVTVATIHLSATGSSGAGTAFGLDALLWDADEYAIPVEVTDGSAVLLLYGDANGDGKVDQADTLRVLKQVVGLTAKPAAGSTDFLRTDVHENRAIDVGDAMFIAQKNADLRDPYFRIR